MKRTTWLSPYRFSPEEHEQELTAIIQEIENQDALDAAALHRILVKYPKNGNAFFSKSEIIRGYRHFAPHRGWEDPESFVEKVRMKPVRTLSGVAPVTVLTQPYPCPGQCIFCPNDVQMPKSYLAREPGAQRAGRHAFDPYQQMVVRLRTLDFMGHPVDKVELIILGGTWSSYPASYQLWFIRRLFEAMNEYGRGEQDPSSFPPPPVDFSAIEETVDGRFETNPYNDIINKFLRAHGDDRWEDDEEIALSALEESHRQNEHSLTRCVGLSVETRPDHVTESELERFRRIGATKVQIGYQSLSDEVLALNKRGHDVAATRRANRLLRQAGFKIQAHWMPNLYGSTPEKDVEDFGRMFADPDFRPDELKIYPCSLVESAELMGQYEAGKWKPYTHDELVEVLTECLKLVPPYCRVSRVIRDIPGEDILVGNKITNFRNIAEAELEARGWRCQDIRSREIRNQSVNMEDLSLDEVCYDTSVGEEVFLQFVTDEKRIVGFLRLCLPKQDAFFDELRASALIREVHVYGAAVNIGKKADQKSQHSGFGTNLIRRAEELSRQKEYGNLAVISSVGTREYYRRLGFRDGNLYQHFNLA